MSSIYGKNIKPPLLHPMHNTQHYHIFMVGICGAGMSGIAEVLVHFGYKVTGSDESPANDTGKHLQSLGIKIYAEHKAKNLQDAQVLVYSSAISEDNVEIVVAKNNNIPCMLRAEMLADLMRYHYGIAVAGTHGKTTTTSIIQYIFESAGEQPTHIAGARLLSQKSNASIGNGKYFIVEADESDASFTHTHPVIAVITNIDKDHMHTYNHDVKALRRHYLEFIHNTPFYGTIVMCGDDEGVQSILNQIHRKIVTYGLNAENNYYADNISQTNNKTMFDFHTPDGNVTSMHTTLFGIHNIQNILASIIVANLQGISLMEIQKALASFPGVSRRFHQDTTTRAGKKLYLIDDYGHHPTEIAATIQAAKNLHKNKRLVLVFQPHRYTRTHDLFDDFVEVLAQVDLLIICSTYSAGEKPLANADSQALCRSIRSRNRIDPIYANDIPTAIEHIDLLTQDNDLVIIQGAGDIAKLHHILVNGN